MLRFCVAVICCFVCDCVLWLTVFVCFVRELVCGVVYVVGVFVCLMRMCGLCVI